MSEARSRVLDTARRLFYAEGIHTVGIDRIIGEANVAKATFYHHFKAKDDLVVAYLTQEYERQSAMMDEVEGSGMPRIEEIFAMLADLSCGPGFRGCPFLNAAAEFPDASHPVRTVVANYRAWWRELMRSLLIEAGHDDPAAGADYLLLIRDGVAVAGGIDTAPAVHSTVRTALAHIIEHTP